MTNVATNSLNLNTEKAFIIDITNQDRTYLNLLLF